MNKFLKNTCGFFFLFIFVIFLPLVLPNLSQNKSIDYSIIQKHNALKKIKSPKYILTGGSNVLFGFDSKILSDSLGLPVVNNAIHAGYGLKYILDDVYPFVKKGDTVILAPEYSHFFDNNRLGSEPLLFSLTAAPENIKLLSLEQLIHISPFIPKFSFGRLKSFIYQLVFNSKKKETNNVYGEFAINSYGDNSSHWSLEKQDFAPYNFSGKFNPKTILLLKNFESKLKEKNATLIITYPSLCNSSYKINTKHIKQVETALNNSGFSIIGKPYDYSFDDTLFFDTPYHLNGKGVIKRTYGLIDLIKNK